MSDRDQTPAPDTTPRDDASGASETVDPTGHERPGGRVPPLDRIA